MNVERIIGDIEQLQEMFEAPDIRPLSPRDLAAANRRHDEVLAHSPWFALAAVWSLLPNGVSSASTTGLELNPTLTMFHAGFGSGTSSTISKICGYC